jgi:hypothetical protein
MAEMTLAQQLASIGMTRSGTPMQHAADHFDYDLKKSAADGSYATTPASSR